MSSNIPFKHVPLSIRRKKLQNKDFSIICQNCMAGIIYHQLGMKFLTPTVNLYFTPTDFIKLLQNLRYYMSQPVLEDSLSDLPFPVGIIGTGDQAIRVYFNHSNSFSKAVEKWDSRKKRINYENLYVIAGDMYDHPYSLEELKAFNALPYNHKILFTGSRQIDIENVVNINNCSINGYLGEWWNRTGDVRNSRYMEEFNYVRFLNDIR